MKLISSYHLAIVLISLGPLWVKASDSRRDQDLEQHYTDVSLLIDSIKDLKETFGVLNYKINENFAMVQKLQTDENAGETDSAICQRVSGYFEMLDKKQKTLENRLDFNLDNFKDEQTTITKNILEKKRNCSSSSNTMTTQAPDSMNDVGEKLTTVHKKFNSIAPIQTTIDGQNIEQIKLFEEINSKLDGHEGKLEILEKKLGDIVQGRRIVSSGKYLIPKNIVLGMTQTSGKNQKS
ncbi:uncharacterized protein LOC142233924 [Haematobia irritans]|uniref:uncharacterized protein LOC142233924 n=1 Tax=Haematobia irritans TaxID=7368 RepID=UPI003F4FBC6A